MDSVRFFAEQLRHDVCQAFVDEEPQADVVLPVHLNEARESLQGVWIRVIREGVADTGHRVGVQLHVVVDVGLDFVG